ncbi:sodium:proton antiporter [Rubrobacter xylanophilus]|uniref:Sodium:proton antiporter n=1 Tax=Rubrobacter xylanophilus TaxID=49319 RepID=A0A510HKE1_9ACTN|nr:cation:proton antiporter [Rubrobacter xylanophilus]BBL80348.1 sodium:proton antiporter [Rubrobacter xylanophilus]
MTELNLMLLIVGGVVLLVGLLSGPIKRSLLSAPLVALLVGVLVGPSVLGLLDPTGWGRQATVLEQAARLTVAISLMGIALRLPSGYPLKSWRSLIVMLGPVMTLMWLASGLLTYFILGLPFWLAMLIGAVLTPTDPVVSSTIVTGKMAEQKLPARLRNLLSGESGANDGLAYPFVFLAILMLERPPTEALTHWLTLTLLWEVLAAVVLGAILGYGAGRLLQLAKEREIIEEPSYLAYTIALSLLVLGAAKLLGTDGVLAVFAAGIALNMAVDTETETEEENVQEAVNRFFVLPIFVLLGMALPWEQWLELGWKGLVLVVAILLFRRLPAVLALSPLLGPSRGRDDALFLGWFGPIGVAALFYATLSVREAGTHEAWVVGSLVICASVLVHGVSAAPLTNLYARRSRETEE